MAIVMAVLMAVGFAVQSRQSGNKVKTNANVHLSTSLYRSGFVQPLKRFAFAYEAYTTFFLETC